MRSVPANQLAAALQPVCSRLQTSTGATVGFKMNLYTAFRCDETTVQT
jgi:hypothetical protein